MSSQTRLWYFCNQRDANSELFLWDLSSRPAGGAKVHHEGYDPSAADWPALVRGHPHVRHHRLGVLHGKIPHYLLQ